MLTRSVALHGEREGGGGSEAVVHSVGHVGRGAVVAVAHSVVVVAPMVIVVGKGVVVVLIR